MNRVYVPATGVADWQRLLADPIKQWKDGYSAKRLADAWQSAGGFPPAVARVLEKSGEPYDTLLPLLVLPEHQVALNGGTAPSQSDAWVLASHAFGLASITVEGKVAETFGPTLAEWLIDASAGKQDRLEFLLSLLELESSSPKLHVVRYQLLHRVASAVLEAKRFKANLAMCIVHSFSPEAHGFADFEAFCALFSKSVKPGEVVRLAACAGIQTVVVWVQDV